MRRREIPPITRRANESESIVKRRPFLYTCRTENDKVRAMPENVTNELLYDVLKKLQTGQAEMKATLSDVVAQLIRVREDIHSLRSDDLRRERVQAQMDVRLERIENRLNLNDPQH